MKTTVTKFVYDGSKFTMYGEHYPSLESAHAEHKQFSKQITFDEKEELNKFTPYLHLMEFRDDEHYNDLYFIWE